MYIHASLEILQAKKDGHSALKSVTKFGLEALYNHFFWGGDISRYTLSSKAWYWIIHSYINIFHTHHFVAHRALAEVEAMERIIVKTGLVDLLSSLPVRSPAQQLDAWATQKNTHNCVIQILTSLGKQITNVQAKHWISADFQQHCCFMIIMWLCI